jgi:hypothetical protein
VASEDTIRIMLSVVEQLYSEYKKQIDDDLNHKRPQIELKDAEYCLWATLRWDSLFYGFDVLQQALEHSDGTELSNRIVQIRSRITKALTYYRGEIDLLTQAAAAQRPADQSGGTLPTVAGPQDYLDQMTQIVADNSEELRLQRKWSQQVTNYTSMNFRLDVAQLLASRDTGYWPRR